MKDDLIGRDIGRFRITQCIAAGGMARVYLGVQPQIGSRVAIKVLAESCANDPALVERFFAEARAVNLIAHENIVNVLDLAVLDDGRPFIVMEYIEGVTLTRAAVGGRAPLGGVVRVFSDVLSALGAAHERGIVHRDLKPDNIIVTAKGHAKVLDFGIAKLSHGSTSASVAASTMAGALLGTPAYMAPEQVSEARDVDARADLYGVGAVLFHAVTGRAPFAGANIFDLMRAQLEDRPPSPRSLRPDLPPALERVIVRALAKDPAHRFASAAEMAAALDDAATAIGDDQWFDLSPKAAPMRVRGSAPRIAPVAEVRRDTPPALSAVTLPRRSSRRWIVVAATALALVIAAGVVFATTRSPEVDASPVPVPVLVAPLPDAEVVTAPRTFHLPLDTMQDPNPSLAEFHPRALEIIATIPGAEAPRLVGIGVWGLNDVGAFSLRFDGVIRYSYELAKPIAGGCRIAITLRKQAIEVTVAADTCHTPTAPLPRCAVNEIWEKLVERNGYRPKTIVYARDGWHGISDTGVDRIGIVDRCS